MGARFPPLQRIRSEAILVVRTFLILPLALLEFYSGHASTDDDEKDEPRHFQLARNWRIHVPNSQGISNRGLPRNIDTPIGNLIRRENDAGDEESN